MKKLKNILIIIFLLIIYMYIANIAQIPKEIIELDASVQCVCINLDKIEQLQKPLEMIELKQISFEKENVRVEIFLKSI